MPARKGPHPPLGARLIRKAYQADPLVCPKCKGPMRVIALIDDPGVVRRILEHLGRWAPEPAERGPPAQAPEWPPNAVIPITYHPVPDIAQRSARLKRARTSASHCAIDSRGSGFAAFRPNRDCKRPGAGATFQRRDARRR